MARPYRRSTFSCPVPLTPSERGNFYGMTKGNVMMPNFIWCLVAAMVSDFAGAPLALGSAFAAPAAPSLQHTFEKFWHATTVPTPTARERRDMSRSAHSPYAPRLPVILSRGLTLELFIS